MFSNSCVCTQLCPTLWDPMDCGPPSFSVHGILQTRMLEWFASPFSRGSSPPRDQTCISCISWVSRQILYHCATWEILSSMKVLVALLCLSLRHLMDCSLPLSMEYCSGLPFPSPDLPGLGIKPRSPALQAESLPSEPPGKST